MSAPALFLDRDGTLVEPRHYPTRPDELVIVAGLQRELRRAQDAGFRLILITNQSGLARGLFDETALARMHDHLTAELARGGVRLEGVYFCPHHPDGSIARYAVACDCRKPAPGMLVRAARDFDLDLGRSWFIGDILDDIEAGNRAGCRTVLVDLGTEAPPTSEVRRPHIVARDACHAVRVVLAAAGLGPDDDLTYLPAGWSRSGSRAIARWATAAAWEGRARWRRS